MRRLFALGLLLVAAFAGAIDLAPDAELRKAITAKLKGRGDVAERQVQRLGNKTISFETWISTEADFKDASTILADTAHFNDWVLTNINKKPGGGEYLLKVLKLETQPGQSNMLITTVLIDLPVFHQELRCFLKLTSRTAKDMFTLLGDVDEMGGTYIEKVEAALKVFPAEGSRLFLYLKGIVKIRSWLLYEAMPERLLKNESGARVQIIVDNYLREETRRRQEKGATARRPNKK